MVLVRNNKCYKNNHNNQNLVFLVLNYRVKIVLMEVLFINIYIFIDIMKDCASPGRSKISKEKDLHKLALKNSFRFC